MLRHVEVVLGITQMGSAAWQSCHQLQIVKPSVVCLQDGVFQGCCVLRQVAAPGCVQAGESLPNAVHLSGVVLKMKPQMSWPQERNWARLSLRAALHSRLTFAMTRPTSLGLSLMAVSAGPASKPSAFPSTSILSAPRPVRTANGWWRLTSARKPSSVAHHFGNSSSRRSCASLGFVAFCGCDQLSLLTLLGEADSATIMQAEDTTFLMCDKFARESWIELLPPRTRMPVMKSSIKGFTN